MPQTLEQLVREMSDRAFAKHGITETGRSGVLRSWRCKRPDEWTYGFDVTTTPGFIFITGDIGDLIVARHYDMLPWCRGSCDSTDYFASKVPQAIETAKFSSDKVREWVEDELKNSDLSDKNRELLEDELDRGLDDRGPSELYGALQPVWCDDPPDWTEWTPNFLWCRDAIRWFVNKIDEPEILKPEPR